MANSQGYSVTQSLWALDADENFKTGPVYSSSDLTSVSSGELQNDYSQCYGFTSAASDWHLFCSVQGAESYPAAISDLNFGARLSNYYLSSSGYGDYTKDFAEYAVGGAATGALSNNYSISAWIYPRSYTGSLPGLHQSKKYNIVSFLGADHPRPSTPTAGTCSIQLFLTGNTPIATSWSVGTRTIVYNPYSTNEIYDDATSSVMVNADEWSHLLLCYDATTPDRDSEQVDRVKLYINGELVDILPSSANQTGNQSPFYGEIRVATGAIGNDASYNTNISTLTGGATPADPDSYFINNVFEGAIADVSLFNYSLHTYDEKLPAMMYNDGCSPYLPSMPVFDDPHLRPTAFYSMGGGMEPLPGPFSYPAIMGPQDTAGSSSWNAETGANPVPEPARLNNRVPILWGDSTGSVFPKGDGYPVRDQFDTLAGIAIVNMSFGNPGPCSSGYDAPSKSNLTASPIYNRRHSLGSVFSVTNFGWTVPKDVYPLSSDYSDRTLTMPIPETSASFGRWLQMFPTPSTFGAMARAFYAEPLGSIQTCGGSAEWEAGRLAGFVRDDAWVSSPEDPFYDSYDEYNLNMKLKNQEYSIVPEFLISDQIDFYYNKQKGDIFAPNYSQFSIKGTTSGTSGIPTDSSGDNFYEIFSNSDFMKNFYVVKQDMKDISAPTTITLKCKTIMKFLPYDGFFPSERSLQIANQFSKSYGSYMEYSGLDKNLTKARFRPFLTPFFRPGIVYNTIKSGLAVDFPIYTSSYQVINYLGFKSNTQKYYTDYYALGTQEIYSSTGSIYTASWDIRVPFEAAVEPEKYLTGISIYDIEPSPNSSLDVQAKWTGEGDILYKRMMHNYLAAIPEFFLPNGEFTSLTSRPESEYLTAQSGTSYGMRVKVRRSMNKPRIWRSYAHNEGVVTYELPQDPRNLTGDAENLRETFTMYSRPSAFGPPVAGTGFLGLQNVVTPQRVENIYYNTDLYPSDSLLGIDPAFTPPYYGRESWADIVWKANQDGPVTIDQIFSEASINYWAIDTNPILDGVTSSVTGVIYGNNRQQAVWSTNEADGKLDYSSPMNVSYANAYAMQINASFNILGKVEDRWVIEPKFETPHMNFNSETSIRPITSASNTLTIPTNGSESVPRGMWHQFGTIETDKGIYIEAGPIPEKWRTVRGYADPDRASEEGLVFSTERVSGIDLSIYQNDNFKDLSTLVGFENIKKLGNTAKSITVSEAVVAVPFTVINGEKQFFEIPEDIIRKALGDLNTISSNKSISQAGTAVKAALSAIEENSSLIGGSSDKKAAKIRAAATAAATAASSQLDRDEEGSDTVSRTIKDMVSKMQKFVFPPSMDFVNNLGKVKPFSMYIFEFSKTFDQTDLSYIWQNLSPPSSEDFSMKEATISHKLISNELMGTFGNGDNDPIKDNLQWMVFKVKQRASNNYFSKISKEFGPKADQFDVSYNWPYDFFSLVEFANIDTQIAFGQGLPPTDTDQVVAAVREDPSKVSKKGKRKK
jgi:hypothetical protein